jgi:hypothetical protein
MKSWLLMLVFTVATATLAQERLATTSDKLLAECLEALKIGQRDGTASSLEGRSCVAYVFGYADGVNTARTMGKAICVPSNATAEQMARVVVKHLQEHRETLRLPREAGIQAAFASAYPCPK